MRATNPLEERVIALIEPAAAELGYRVVRVRLMGLRRKTLQVMAERESDGLFSPNDCGRLSRAIVEPLEDIEYDNLEVSSPGIDRPLVRLEDFERHIGHDAKLEAAMMIDGQKKYRGVILGVADGKVRLNTERGEVALPFAGLANARLVLTDRLIADDLRRAKAAEQDEAETIAPDADADIGPGPRRDALRKPYNHAAHAKSPASGGAKKSKRKTP